MVSTYAESLNHFFETSNNKTIDSALVMTRSLQKKHDRKFDPDGIRKWLNDKMAEPTTDVDASDELPADTNYLLKEIFSEHLFICPKASAEKASRQGDFAVSTNSAIKWLTTHHNQEVRYEELEPFAASIERLSADMLSSIKDKSCTLLISLQKEHGRIFNRDGVRRWLTERGQHQGEPVNDSSSAARGNKQGADVLSDENRKQLADAYFQKPGCGSKALQSIVKAAHGETIYRSKVERWLSAHKAHEVDYDDLEPYKASMQELAVQLKCDSNQWKGLKSALNKKHGRIFKRCAVERWLRNDLRDQAGPSSATTILVDHQHTVSRSYKLCGKQPVVDSSSAIGGSDVDQPEQVCTIRMRPASKMVGPEAHVRKRPADKDSTQCSPAPVQIDDVAGLHRYDSVLRDIVDSN